MSPDEDVHTRPAGDSVGAENPAEAVAVLRSVLESPEDIVIFALDREYRYLAFNASHSKTMRHIWDVDIAVGESMLDAIGREDDREKARANFDRVLAGEAFKQVESYGDEALGRRWFEDAYSPIRDAGGAVIGLTVFLTDVTDDRNTRAELAAYRHELEALVAARTKELEATQKQLLRAQKLESLGLMAGGVAHDFNNLLVGILGCAEIARTDLGDGHASASLLDEVIRAATRASGLTGQMLAYAGHSPQRLRPSDLRRCIEEQRGLLRAVVPHSVELVFELAEVPSIDADPSQLHQVILNLVTNAAEAHDGPGRISVSTELRRLDATERAEFALGSLARDDEYVVLRVRDAGRGMTPQALDRLFDPFFSTKDSGRGLGLSSVLGIVRSHGADIAVRSTKGAGTTFDVAFFVGRPAPDAVPTSPKATAERQHRYPNLTALIVDDEAPVRSVVEMMLDQLEMKSVQAEDGAAGIERLEQLGAGVGLVILDLTMPRQGGIETLEKIRSGHASLPVLVVSGYDAASQTLELGETDPYTHFLAKPFTVRQFHRSVNALLQGEPMSRRVDDLDDP